MNDKLARTIAAVSLAVALVSLVIAGYSLSLVEDRTAQVRTLAEALTRALASQQSADVPLHAPPPALDPGP